MKLIISNIRRLVGISVIAGFASLAARADTPPPPPPPGPGVLAACRQDLDTFCPGIQPGEGRIAACLKANHRALSPGCKEAIRERHQEHMQSPGTAAPPAPPPAAPPPPPPSH